jgi:CBS domain-containing protein
MAPNLLNACEPPESDRLQAALQQLETDTDIGVDLMTTPVSKLVSRPPVVLSPHANIREAAAAMTREQISSLMVAADDQLKGIVTDRDLRCRVIAKGLPPDRTLGDIMTPAPVTVEAHSTAYEALLVMARNRIHHLPVLQDEKIVGMITATDLLNRRSTSPLHLISDVYRQPDIDGLIDTSQRLPSMVVTLVEANASAHSIGHLVSSVGDAITCRLLMLAEQRFGPPPIPYAWLTGGSMARRDQTAHSDQDNCLLLADTYRAEEHGAYFTDLSDFVCDALDACGYVYCPGEVMAKTEKWRQPFSTWESYFDQWIDQPDPKALMHACIFFDLRCLYGDLALFQALQTYIVEKAASNRIFHAYMAANAMTHEPPLGFLRNFALIRGGEHDRMLDLKHNGVVPIIDLARVHALAGGVAVVNTRDRLEAAADRGALSPDGAANLRDALEFIGTVRLRHQACQIKAGKQPDNFMSPRDLSPFERNHLKDAFAVVRKIQAVFSQRYQVGRMG